MGSKVRVIFYLGFLCHVDIVLVLAQKVILQVDWSSENKKKKAIKMVSQNEGASTCILSILNGNK